MAKIKLDLEPDPQVLVFGISSHVNDYRLCWSLNRRFDLELTRRRGFIIDEANGVKARYGAFDHFAEHSWPLVTLVNNHSGDGILLKEYRQADFFLVVNKDLAEDMPDLLARLRATEFVLTAFELPYDQIRSGHKLLQ